VLLRAEQLAAFRADRLVFENVSFDVPDGGVLLLVGPNGAGKSTLLRLVAGLGRAAAGRVLWRGEDAFADPARHAARLAYVGHQDAVKAAFTVAETLRTPGGAGRAVADALEALGLASLADLPVRMLSAGQRRRLALARLALGRLALVPASLWLLDEPTLGLDADSVERLGVLLARHRARGGAAIIATHLPLPLDHAATLAMGA
jgi:heme exporter protein A